MEIKFTDKNLKKTVKEILVPLLQKYTIFAFIGPLGVGKTTIIKEILKQCGIKETVTSPTFGYVNSYKNKLITTFHHFDLYRIDSVEAFIEAAFDEYLYQEHNISFIEWPEVIAALLENKKLKKLVCYVILAYDPSNPSIRIIKI